MPVDATMTVAMPMALGIIMFGLGLSLTGADFARILQYPRAVVVGLGCQLLFLPLIAAGVAHAMALPPELSVGLMLLAASPGGISSSLYSQLARGDVALNITLTAINSVLSIVTLPLIVGLAMLHFLGADRDIPLQFSKVLQVFTVVLGPVLLGMLLNARAPQLAQRLRTPVKRASVLLLLAVIAVAIVKSRAEAVGYLASVGAACLLFNVLSLLVGYGVPRLLKLDRRQSIAIGMEIGIHNSTIAITVALSPLLLNSPAMAIPPAVYGVMMFFTAGAFGWLVNRGTPQVATQRA